MIAAVVCVMKERKDQAPDEAWLFAVLTFSLTLTD